MPAPEAKQRVGLSAPGAAPLAKRAGSAGNAGWLVDPGHEPGVRIQAGGHEPGNEPGVLAVTHAGPGVVTAEGVDRSEPDLSEPDRSETDLGLG